MLEALIAATVAMALVTGLFWRLPRDGRSSREAAKYHFLPWLLGVIGVALVLFQILLDAIDYDDVFYALFLVGAFVGSLVWVKSLMPRGARSRRK